MLDCEKENYENRLPESNYRQCGMFLNNSSLVPLWTVDWSGYIYLPNGGEFVVKRGRWARTSGTYNEEVLSFFSNGKLLKSQSTRNLIDFPWLLIHSSSHYQWQTPDGMHLSNDGEGGFSKLNYGQRFETNAGVDVDDENKTILVTTIFSDKIKFDLKTGKLISTYRPSRILFLFLSLILIASYFLFRRKLSISKVSSLLVSLVFFISVLVLPLSSVVPFFTEKIEGISFLGYRYYVILEAFYRIPAYFFGFFGVSFVSYDAIAIHGNYRLLLWSMGFWTVFGSLLFIFDRVFLRIIQKVKS